MLSRAFFVSSLGLVVAVASACPTPPPPVTDAGQINLADAGPFVPPPDAGFDDGGVPIVVDAGPINTSVFITNVADPLTGPTGPLAGLNRVRIDGDGFTGACSLSPTPGSGECHVFFGDVEADLINGISLPTSMSVRVPPGVAPGLVDVKVVTALGIGILENGYTYFSPITIDGIEPAIGSSEGGDDVEITGVGLSEQMILTIGERQVVGLVVAPDGTSARFLTPPGAPGRADVAGTDAFGRGELPLAFTYQSPLRLDGVDPVVVDPGDVVELAGSGFFDDDADALAVTIGGAAAARDNLISEARLRVVVPAGLVGAQDVAVARGALGDALADALVVRPALSGAFVLSAAVPARLDVDGGTQVTLVGEGFTSATGVTVNGVPGSGLVVVDDGTVTFTAPAGALGAATIALVRADASSATTSASYFAPLVVDVVDGVAPAFGPAAGGTAVTINGRGFGGAGGAPSVTFGGIPATDVVVASATSITATTPAGAAGFVDVVVTAGGERAAAEDGFRFEAALSVLGVRPARGALAGNTFVTVTGTGFTRGAVTLTFDGVPAFEVSVVNDSTLTARTPPRFSGGLVDVGASFGAQSPVFAEDAFAYFNAGGNVVGGARGGPIDGAVYITALDATFGLPIPGLIAYVGTGDTPAAASLTNAFGQATISGPDIHGPQTVTVTGDCFSAVTFVDVNAAELTAFLFAFCPPPPRPPPPPPPPPPPLPTIRGRVFGFAKEFFDPAALDQSGCTSGPPAKCEFAFAEVNTTTVDEFGRNPPAGGLNVVFEEGGEYFIGQARTGRLALVALAGIFDTNNDRITFRQMGVRRELNPARGDVLIDQDIELTIPLDSEIDLSLPDSPMRFDTLNIGKLPTITRVVPFIQLGGEGAFVYTQAVEGKRNHALEEMPDVPGELLTFVAGAYTTDGRNLYTDFGTASVTEGEIFVTGTDNFDWGLTDANNQFLAVGKVFVTDRPNGTRFASVVEGVVVEQDGFPVPPILQLQEAPDFTSTNASYHIGTPGAPSSEVMQDGVGDLRSGVTIQPVLGFPELLSPEEDGVLVDRTLRWKAPPGQQPTIHDMFVYDALAFTSIWELYVDGSRTKVIIPRVPAYEDILAALPLDQRTCLTTLDPPPELETYCGAVYPGYDELNPPPDGMINGALFWQHESIFAPNLDANNWSLLQIGFRGRRSWTTDVHAFVHGDD